MTTFFIADLHLDPHLSPLTQRFLTFLKEEAPKAEALYILGDLFNAWLGDDNITAFSLSICEGLKQLRRKGVPVYIMKGNRDFLMGQSFAEQCEGTLLPNIHRISLYGKPTLLCHGDHLCTHDKRHQLFRYFSHHPLIQKLIYQVPLSYRKKLSFKIRKISGKHIKNKDFFDVNEKAVETHLKRWNALQIIHGHTHRPAIHERSFYRRMVLSDWTCERGNVLKYHEDGKAELCYF